MNEAYQLSDLAYDYGALEPHIGGKIMEVHHNRHQAAYVKGANAALERLADAPAGEDFAIPTMLQKDLAFHLSGRVLQSLVWTNLLPDGGGVPDGEPMAECIVVQQVHDHQGDHGQGTMPLLVIDAREHAFYLEYLNAKGDFFDGAWRVVNWADVAARLAAARRLNA
jgi:Fe-Mn family superoxide dismutase